MLRFIACSGFKSLLEFELELNKGLNILVGPNGSGKTNIILFLEFLSNLRRGPLMEAVSAVGGAGKIFRRGKMGRPEKNISFLLRGAGYFTEPARREFYANYEYSATVSLVLELNEIVYSHQHLKMVLDCEANPHHSTSFDIKTFINELGEVSVVIDKADFKCALYISRAKEENILIDEIKHSLEFSRSLSLIETLQRIIIGPTLLAQDLFGAKALNIDPNKVRESEDVATPPIIRSDGVGFAATMFALQPSIGPYLRYTPNSIKWRFPDPESLLREILLNASLVNDSVRGIFVEQDTLESKLRVSIDLSYENGSTLRLPISLVSDGTAKWLALVAAVITNCSVFAIEEPENFLHPAMQREIINLVRAQYDEHLVKTHERFAIMTTHSETILDNARPDELIVVSMEQGVTTARRPLNASLLLEQIGKTGFGLGHFYRSGAVE